MKIGLYSVTYRGVWYRGAAVDLFNLVHLAKQQGWEGLELDAERPHAAPMDLSTDDRKRLRELAGEVGLELCAVSPNCDISSPVPIQREVMISYVRAKIDWLTLGEQGQQPDFGSYARGRSQATGDRNVKPLRAIR